MTLCLPGLRHFRAAPCWLVVLLLCSTASTVSAQKVILELKSGDRVGGRIVSENAHRLVISNSWAAALSIPLSEIAARKTNTVAAAASRAPSAVRKHPPPHPPKTVSNAPLKPRSRPKGTWHGHIRIGLDAIFNTRDQQDYYGDIKLTYQKPYRSNPKKFFRNTTQIHAEYLKTDGKKSANRAQFSNKSDFDVADSFYASGLAGVGYDEVRKIDLQYKFGPGIGNHLIARKSYVLNVETGLNYEAQYRRDTDNLETFYLRLALDSTWRIQQNLKWTHEVAFYPDLEEEGQYHNDFSSTLSYGFWRNLSLNLTVLDDYNTEVAPGVNQNRLELRFSLGWTL